MKKTVRSEKNVKTSFGFEFSCDASHILDIVWVKEPISNMVSQTEFLFFNQASIFSTSTLDIFLFVTIGWVLTCLPTLLAWPAIPCQLA